MSNVVVVAIRITNTIPQSELANGALRNLAPSSEMQRVGMTRPSEV